DKCTQEEINELKLLPYSGVDVYPLNFCPRGLETHKPFNQEIQRFGYRILMSKCPTNIKTICIYNQSLYDTIEEFPNNYELALRAFAGDASINNYDEPVEYYQSFDVVYLGGEKKINRIEFMRENIVTKGGLKYFSNFDIAKYVSLKYTSEIRSTEEKFIGYLGAFEVGFSHRILFIHRDYKTISSALAH